jgi:hypothetical protein
MPQQYDPDAVFVGAGLIVAGALAAAMASVALAVVAARLIRRAIRARSRQEPAHQQAACDRDIPHDRVTLSDREYITWLTFRAVFDSGAEAEERDRMRGDSEGPSS